MYSLLILSILLGISLIGILVYSICCPSKRIWPPPGRGTWQYYLTWLLCIACFVLLFIIGMMDWNCLGWPAAVRWGIGGSLVVLGNLLAWIAVAQLGARQTTGEKGKLMTRGLYKFSRNPQYLGDILIIAGWMILSASVWCLPLTLAGVVAFALTPFAEEPWLEELHGDDYRQYKSRVPRFILF